MPEKKTYNYRGKEYTMRPVTLGVKSALVDLISERNRLVYEATKDIDMKALRQYELKEKRLTERIEQCKAGGKDPSQPERELELLREDKATNSEVQAALNFRDQQLSLVSLRLLYNEELMTRLVGQLIDPVVSLDFASPETEPFLNAVINDFFFMSTKSSSG